MFKEKLIIMGERLSGPAAKVGLLLKAKSPEIAIAAGIVLAGAAVVLAIKGTKEAEPVIKEHKEEMEVIASNLEEHPERFEKNDGKKAIIFRFGKTVKGLLKAYAPSIAALALSAALILWSHGMMKARYAALAASYQALESTYKEYQDKVKNELGADKEQALMKDILKEQEEKAEKQGNRIRTMSPYERIFDECNFPYGFKHRSNIQNDAKDNYIFLRFCERKFMSRLISRGFVSLNEVIEELGGREDDIVDPRIGWKYIKNHPIYGNTFIDFGLDGDHAKAFKNGLDRAVMLRFNCSQNKF